MNLLRANHSEREIGWKLSYKLLSQIQEIIQQKSDEVPSFEQIEDVLLAFEEINSNEK